ncbi:hypothetical protein GCM10022234_09760 [Aeromicrobium panaciterrae]|uniref:hypothetical protein n=1 Tax=Aeromicrobium panaciterrae TaxID=363861 RepID=UPI0031E2BBA3
MNAWDQLLDLVDHLAADSEVPLDESERTFAALCTEAVAQGSVDSELHVDDTARWLRMMISAHRAERAAHPEIDSDVDVAVLRLIVTRWLHPHRLDQRESEPRT